MSTVIERVVLPAPPEELYATYLDPQAHGMVTGAVVTMSGGAYTAFDGQVRGRFLRLEPGRLIVQEWGSAAMGDGHLVVLAFDAVEAGTEVSLLHIGIPDDKVHLVDWEGRYWAPWRRRLTALASRHDEVRIPDTTVTRTAPPTPARPTGPAR